jgi:hypothetical protein
VRGSPYPSARIDARATLAKKRRRQHIAVAAFRRKNRATYTVVAFAAPAGRAPVHAGRLDRLLASLRTRRPAG